MPNRLLAVLRTATSVLLILLLTGCNPNAQMQATDMPSAEMQSKEMQSTDMQSIQIPASQEASSTPESPVEMPVSFPMSSFEFVADMGIGWNLGNSFDPVDCTWLTDEMDYETAWGNEKVTRELIHFIREQGFDTIRIPVTWTNHVGAAPDYPISSAWLDRVQEVVDWCMEEDLYVILNIHHESNWLTKASTDYDGTMVKYRAIWTQLADRFGDYSDKLLFESMNEIGFDDLGTEQGCELMNRINGEFTELIRSCGKNNADRYLMLAGYWTDIDSSCQGIVMPSDDKVILSVHYYSPADFAIAEAGSTWGYRKTWGTAEDFAYMEGQFEKLKTTFLDNNIPVVMGEFGCVKKDKASDSRILYLSAVADYCRQYGICPIFWDNGEEIDRVNLQWRTEGLAEKLLLN